MDREVDQLDLAAGYERWEMVVPLGWCQCECGGAWRNGGGDVGCCIAAVAVVEVCIQVVMSGSSS